MTLKELIEKSKEEVIEPETIRTLFPAISEEDFNYLEAIITIKNTNYPFENFYVFEDVVSALSGIIPKFDMLEGSEPEWIWYACDVFQELRPQMELSDEVIEYIKKIYADSGIYFLHPYITKNDTKTIEESWKVVYNAAKHKAETGPFPIEVDDDSLINRQAIEFMKMELYSKQLKEKNK